MEISVSFSAINGLTRRRAEIPDVIFLQMFSVLDFQDKCWSIVQDSYNEKYDTITAQYSTVQHNTTQYKYNTNASARAPYASVNPRPRLHDNLMHSSCLAVFEILAHSLFYSLAHSLTKTARHETKTTTNHTTKWNCSRSAQYMNYNKQNIAQHLSIYQLTHILIYNLCFSVM